MSTVVRGGRGEGWILWQDDDVHVALLLFVGFGAVVAAAAAVAVAAAGRIGSEAVGVCVMSARIAGWDVAWIL